MLLSALFLLYLLNLHIVFSSVISPGLHFHLHRRGSRFLHHESANLTKHGAILSRHEERYGRVYRKIENNRLLRRWRQDCEDSMMLVETGSNGTWYFTMKVGDPVQLLEVDIDMLSPDWFHIMTSSGQGSKYDTFLSNSHVPSDTQVHTICYRSSDIFYLSNSDPGHTLDWPICKPSHSSRHTLHKSGTILGLAPYRPDHPSTLSRLDAPPLLTHLYNENLITHQIWSITILDSTSGVLSLGGTLAREIEEVKARIDAEFKHMGQQGISAQEVDDEVNGRIGLLGPTTEEQFKWIDVHGAEGWWQGLISGVFLNGVKILKNQPFILDLSFPFIHVPASSFQHLQSSVPGSQSMSPRYLETFTTFPCLNPPEIALEIGGWRFNLGGQDTRQDSLHGPAGGRLSLGRVDDFKSKFYSGDHASDDTPSDNRDKDSHKTERKDNDEQDTRSTGYCVSILVGRSPERKPGDDTKWDESGMSKTWILGEPFFRGMGIVFDSGGEEGKEGGEGGASEAKQNDKHSDDSTDDTGRKKPSKRHNERKARIGFRSY